MMTKEQIVLAHTLLATGLLSKVYHSVTMHADERGDLYPVYAKGGEQFYVGPNDKKERFAYIRQTGPVAKGDEVLEGSENKIYRLSAPVRIIIFKDREKESFDFLISRLLTPIFSDAVSLVSYQHDAFKLAKQESPIGNFAFDATTFYLAIDIQLRWWINDKICEVPCIIHPNPICL